MSSSSTEKKVKFENPYDADIYFTEYVEPRMSVSEETNCMALYKNLNTIIYFTSFYFKKTFRDLENLVVFSKLKLTVIISIFVIFPVLLLFVELPRLVAYLSSTSIQSDLYASSLSVILILVCIAFGLWQSKKLLKRVSDLKKACMRCSKLAIEAIDLQLEFNNQLLEDSNNIYKTKDTISELKDRLLFASSYRSELEIVKEVYNKHLYQNQNFIYSAVTERIFNLHASFNAMMNSNISISPIQEHIKDMKMLHEVHKDSYILSIKNRKSLL